VRLFQALAGCLVLLCITATWVAACGTTTKTVTPARDDTSNPDASATPDMAIDTAQLDVGPPPPEPGPIAMPDATAPTKAHAAACDKVCMRLWRVTRGRRGKAAWVAECAKACTEHGSSGQLTCLERVETAEQLAACEAR